jgi:hypothetical protein
MKDFSELTDEEIMNMSAPPSEEEPVELGTDSVDPESDPQSEAEDEAEGVDEVDAGGAADLDSESDESVEADDDLEPESADSATHDPFSGATDEAAEDDQSEDTSDESPTEEDRETDDGEFRSKYEELMAPFKAAGRDIKLDNPEQARRLMQMGVDYNQKMQTMKPYLKVLRSLEKANLLDQDRVNFLIDLSNNNSDAIKKLLKDNSIDPMELDLEDSDGYVATDHSVSDQEMGVRAAFEAIESTPTFDRTLQVLTKEWDQSSRAMLADNPSYIGLMHNHIANGTYDQVWGEVVKLRMLGELVGLSDLDAYNQAGQAMYDGGKLADPQPASSTSSAGDTTQKSAQGNGSTRGSQKRTAQKRAASPTKGGASGGGATKVPNLAEMSDEDIMKLDPRTLSKL